MINNSRKDDNRTGTLLQTVISRNNSVSRIVQIILLIMVRSINSRNENRRMKILLRTIIPNRVSKNKVSQCKNKNKKLILNQIITRRQKIRPMMNNFDDERSVKTMLYSHRFFI